MNCIFLRRGYGEIETTPPAPEILSNFSANDWSTIIYACQNNLVPSSWAVGNNKTMNIGGTNYQIDIIGIQHDTYSDGSGTAPLTFQMHDCYGTTYAMKGTSYNNSNSGGWRDSDMRNTHLPSILTKMPSEVQAAIKEVNKKGSAGNTSSNINTTADKLFLLAINEMSTEYTGAAYTGEGSRYPYYANGGSMVKKVNGTASKWWTRTPLSTTTTSFIRVSTTGGTSGEGSTFANGVSFAFCF